VSITWAGVSDSATEIEAVQVGEHQRAGTLDAPQPQAVGAGQHDVDDVLGDDPA
jgi:hypothetical protein